MKSRSLTIVRETLQAYADRGIFRGFSETRSGRFTFDWMFDRQMELVVDTAKASLRFKQILPGLPANAPLYAELKEFIQLRHDRALPEHRRVERRRAEVSCSNRGGVVSISLKVKNNQYAYGAKKLVNLVHELFVHLRAAHPEYLMENFDAPQE